MSWNGEPGAEGRGNVMATEEAISNMCRLNLTGKLSLAVSKYYSMGEFLGRFYVPFYDRKQEFKKEDIVLRINLQYYQDPRVFLMERELSILLKTIQGNNLALANSREIRHAR